MKPEQDQLRAESFQLFVKFAGATAYAIIALVANLSVVQMLAVEDRTAVQQLDQYLQSLGVENAPVGVVLYLVSAVSGAAAVVYAQQLLLRNEQLDVEKH